MTLLHLGPLKFLLVLRVKWVVNATGLVEPVKVEVLCVFVSIIFPSHVREGA